MRAAVEERLVVLLDRVAELLALDDPSVALAELVLDEDRARLERLGPGPVALEMLEPWLYRQHLVLDERRLLEFDRNQEIARCLARAEDLVEAGDPQRRRDAAAGPPGRVIGLEVDPEILGPGRAVGEPGEGDDHVDREVRTLRCRPGGSAG